VEYAEAFSIYDTDDTNTIPVRSLDLVLKSLGVVFPEARIQDLTQRKHDEGESHVTFEEFLYLVGPDGTSTWQYAEDCGKSRAQKLKSALGVFDTQGYGTITVADLRRALREALRDHEIDDLVKHVDPKQTGKVEVQALSEYLVGF
jgi:Ca2+-binding EF-hand superfamily protein